LENKSKDLRRCGTLMGACSTRGAKLRVIQGRTKTGLLVVREQEPQSLDQGGRHNREAPPSPDKRKKAEKGEDVVDWNASDHFFSQTGEGISDQKKTFVGQIEKRECRSEKGLGTGGRKKNTWKGLVSLSRRRGKGVIGGIPSVCRQRKKGIKGRREDQQVRSIGKEDFDTRAGTH